MNPNNWNESVRKGFDLVAGAGLVMLIAFDVIALTDAQNAALGTFALAVRTLFWSIFPGYNTAGPK